MNMRGEISVSAKDLEETENGITNPKDIYKGLPVESIPEAEDEFEVLQQYLLACLTSDYMKLMYGVELNSCFSRVSRKYTTFCKAHAADTEVAKAILFHSTLGLIKTELIPETVRHYDIYCKMEDGYTDEEIGINVKKVIMEDQRYLSYDNSQIKDVENIDLGSLAKKRDTYTVEYATFPMQGLYSGTVKDPVFEDVESIMYNLLILRWLSKSSIATEENAFDLFLTNVADITKGNISTMYRRELFNHFVFKFALGDAYPRNLPSGRVYSILNFSAANKLALTGVYCNNVTALRSFMSDITFTQSGHIAIDEESIIRNLFCLCATILAYESENREFATLYAKAFM